MSIINKAVLCDDHTNKDDKEVFVVEDSLCDVLVFNACLSTVDHVENVKEDESVEAVGEE